MNYKLMDHTRLKITSTASRISLLLHAELLFCCKQDFPPDASRSDGSVLVSAESKVKFYISSWFLFSQKGFDDKLENHKLWRGKERSL